MGMIITFRSISLGLIWLLAGGLYAGVFVYTIRWSVMKQLHPLKKNGSVFLLVGLTFLRTMIIMILIFLAIRMNILYALILLFGFGVVRWILVIHLNRSHGSVEPPKYKEPFYGS